MASQDLRGTLHFTMLYDPIAGILTIRLIEVDNRSSMSAVDKWNSIHRLRTCSRETSVAQPIHTPRFACCPTLRRLTCGKLEFTNELSTLVSSKFLLISKRFVNLNFSLRWGFRLRGSSRHHRSSNAWDSALRLRRLLATRLHRWPQSLASSRRLIR